MKNFVWLIFGLMGVQAAFAASFDCHAARLTDIEKQVCADPSVSAQDEKLTSLYRKLMAGATAPYLDAMKADQQQWLSEVRDRCSYKDCLGNAYQARIRSLEEIETDGWDTWVPEREVFSELSRRSGISESELTELFRDNADTQWALNMGWFGSFIAVDLKLKKMLAKRVATMPGCRASLEASHAEWERSRDKDCKRAADDEAEGGSMVPMLIAMCQADATKKRIVYLKTLKTCK